MASNPVISSTTAAKILIDNYRRCEDWTLAIAGYNCGMGRISQSINKAGINKWDETVKFLPKETQEYIPSLLAIYYVWCYKNELGFNI